MVEAKLKGSTRKNVSNREPFKSSPAFLPNLCHMQAVLLLLLLGELLALLLTLARLPYVQGFWEVLGLHSVLVQWIVLLSACVLCPLRYRLSVLNPMLAGSLVFVLVIGVAGVCIVGGHMVVGGGAVGSKRELIVDLLLATLIAAVVLRYLYLSQQLRNREQAEMMARIDALQARIHPHFLFNTLNTIASLVSSRPQLAEEVIEDLCDVFRASLAKPGMVTLADERALCEQYLSIEKLRLGDRLQIDWQVSPALQTHIDAIPMPRLILQPLAENAIAHGLSQMTNGGVLRLCLSLSQEPSPRLEVVVENPVAENAESNISAGNGMALDNIRSRLQAIYGRQALFHAGRVGQGFVVKFSYPVEYDGYITRG